MGGRKVSIYDVTVSDLAEAVCRGAAPFPLVVATWLPVLFRRLLVAGDTAEDCLLNPIFRWCFLASGDRLKALEVELSQVQVALGDAFPALQSRLLAEIGAAPNANQAHDRLLDARAELRGMHHYAAEGYSLTVEPERTDGPAHDFNADGALGHVAVEAKFVRRSDKVGAYLQRWMQAQTDTTGSNLFFTPLIHFDWNRDIGKGELRDRETTALKELCRDAFGNHEKPGCTSVGRLQVRFQYRTSLPLPLPGSPPDLVTPLMAQITSKVQQAFDSQLSAAKKAGRPVACYVLVNLDDEADFHYGEAYRERLAGLVGQWKASGLEMHVVPDAGYI